MPERMVLLTNLDFLLWYFNRIGLTASAKLLYLDLISNSIPKSRSELSRRTGMTTSTLKNALQQLKSHKLIERDNNIRRARTDIKIDPSDLKEYRRHRRSIKPRLGPIQEPMLAVVGEVACIARLSQAKPTKTLAPVGVDYSGDYPYRPEITSFDLQIKQQSCWVRRIGRIEWKNGIKRMAVRSGDTDQQVTKSGQAKRQYRLVMYWSSLERKALRESGVQPLFVNRQLLRGVLWRLLNIEGYVKLKRAIGNFFYSPHGLNSRFSPIQFRGAFDELHQRDKKYVEKPISAERFGKKWGVWTPLDSFSDDAAISKITLLASTNRLYATVSRSLIQDSQLEYYLDRCNVQNDGRIDIVYESVLRCFNRTS